MKEVRGRGLLIGVQLGESTSAYLRQAWTMMHKINPGNPSGLGARPTPKKVGLSVFKTILGWLPSGALVPSASKHRCESHIFLRILRLLCDVQSAHFLATVDTRALEVTPNRVNAYMEKRQREGAVPATINREVEGLQRAFALAVDHEELTYAPRFKSLPEHNARQGFFERADFESILPRLTMRGKPDTNLQDFLSWCFWTGMRTGETKSLKWADFDGEAWTIRLHPRGSKNRKGRAIPLENELRQIVERRMAARRMDCLFIFHRSGHQMGEFRKVWKRACEEAGLMGKTPHDFRRSAVRNMVRAGVNPDIARQTSGHRTAAIFSRYNIIIETDLRQAMQRTSEYVATLSAKSKIHALKGFCPAFTDT